MALFAKHESTEQEALGCHRDRRVGRRLGCVLRFRIIEAGTALSRSAGRLLDRTDGSAPTQRGSLEGIFPHEPGCIALPDCNVESQAATEGRSRGEVASCSATENS